MVAQTELLACPHCALPMGYGMSPMHPHRYLDLLCDRHRAQEIAEERARLGAHMYATYEPNNEWREWWLAHHH